MIFRLAQLVLMSVVSLASPTAFAQFYSTGYTGANCTACGNIWPWSPACRWGQPTSVRGGWHRTSFGAKGSAACHDGQPESLPLTESVSFKMTETETYKLESGSWSWFDLTASYEYAKTSEITVIRPNSCYQLGCCLVPFKAFIRRSYDQRVRVRQISKVWYFCPGTSVPCYTTYEDCVACDPTTRQLGVLLSHPSPELLSAAQAAITNMPDEDPIYTIATYCASQLP